MYKYKMVQLPRNVSVLASKETGSEAADYLQSVVNSKATDGWEFFRVDEIGVEKQPGCFGALLGRAPIMSSYYVATFRKDE